MIKEAHTLLNKKRDPKYYFYLGNNLYPDFVGNKIKNDEITKFSINHFKALEPLFLMKNRNMKDIDIASFPNFNTFVVSKKFKETFESKIKSIFLNTSEIDFYLFIIDNIIDCVDMDKSKIIYQINDRKYTYIKSESIIILNENILNDQLLFSIPEEPLKTLCTESFIDLCKGHNINNIAFKDF